MRTAFPGSESLVTSEFGRCVCEVFFAFVLSTEQREELDAAFETGRIPGGSRLRFETWEQWNEWRAWMDRQPPARIGPR